VRCFTTIRRVRRHLRVVLPALFVAFLGSAALGWADDPPPCAYCESRWAERSGPGVFTAAGDVQLDLHDNTDFAIMDVPAGTYHVSGEVSVDNWTYFDHDLSCRLYAAEAGEVPDAPVDVTAGALPAVDNGRYPNTFFSGGFSTVVELDGAGRVWTQCSGTETGQSDNWTWGDEAKHQPEYPTVVVDLIATRLRVIDE
jgi:hypothetical protein